MFTSQFPRLFLWHVVRNARRHPLLAGLNILSVALGVSVYLAIQIANHSANQSFSASIDLVAGKANLEARACERQPGRNPAAETDPTRRASKRRRRSSKATPPCPTSRVITCKSSGSTFTRTCRSPPLRSAANPAPTDPTSTWTAGWAIRTPWRFRTTSPSEHGLKVGDPIRLQINGREQSLTIRFLIRQADTAAGRGNSRIAAMDIGWAQELFQRVGKLSSVQILLDRPADAGDMARRLGKLVPADVTISTPGARSGQVERMLASFQLNLSALSLISLLVGMFLIYNTITASVVRRRVETGILRAVGASRLEVQCLFLAEALFFGVIGVALGLVGGTLLARFSPRSGNREGDQHSLSAGERGPFLPHAAARRQRIFLWSGVGPRRRLAARPGRIESRPGWPH